MIKAVLFDCFGVLITDRLEALLTPIRLHSPAVAQEIHDTIQLANKGILMPLISSQKIASLLQMSHAEYRDYIDSGEQKNNTLLEYIVDIRKEYKTALLSNIGRGSLNKRFSEEELSRYFDVVVASGEVGLAKPEARIYELTAERLGIRTDECIFIDDRMEYIEGAQAVGMKAVLFTSNQELFTALHEILNVSW